MNCLRQNLQNSIPTKTIPNNNNNSTNINNNINLDYTPINEKKQMIQVNNNDSEQKYICGSQLGQSYSTQPSFRSPISGGITPQMMMMNTSSSHLQQKNNITCFDEEFDSSFNQPAITPSNNNNHFSKKLASIDNIYKQPSLFSDKSDTTITLFNHLEEGSVGIGNMSNRSNTNSSISNTSSSSNSINPNNNNKATTFSDNINTTQFSLQNHNYATQNIMNNFNGDNLNTPTNSKSNQYFTPFINRNLYIENSEVEFFTKKGKISCRYDYQSSNQENHHYPFSQSSSSASSSQSQSQSQSESSQSSSSPCSYISPPSYMNENIIEDNQVNGLSQRLDSVLEVSDFTSKIKAEDINYQSEFNYDSMIPQTPKKQKIDQFKDSLSSPERLGLQAGLLSRNNTFSDKYYENQLNYSSTNSNNANNTQTQSTQMLPSSIWKKSSKQKFSKKKVDRFIPSRKTSKLNIALSSAHEVRDENSQESYVQKGDFYDKQSQLSIEELYKCHILGIQNKHSKTPFGISQSQFSEYFSNNRIIPQNNESYSNGPYQPIQVPGDENEVTRTIKSYQNQNLLRFKDSPNRNKSEIGKYVPEYNNKYSLIDNQNQCIFDFQRKQMRNISKIPFKVLDAPSLQDDFYLNLVDWSGNNILAVALGSCVYLWKAENNKVIKFCDLGESTTVTSVGWHPKANQLSLGTSTGEVQVWDANNLKIIRKYDDHAVRVGSLSWSTQVLACGSRDKTISMRDVRDSSATIRKLQEHKQEVCGLKWSFDEQQLASGGNDNKLFVWNNHSNMPICKFTHHTAAVKAIAWSPHQHGLLASGGGTQDRCIRFWNTQNTQSQVCNLMFGKTENEIVSTHGYSLNQIVIWKYPSMQKITELTGHTSRVLFLAMSPDGQTIVTGAGDETLRFWNVFPSSNQGYKPQSVLINDVRDLR